MTNITLFKSYICEKKRRKKEKEDVYGRKYHLMAMKQKSTSYSNMLSFIGYMSNAMIKHLI